MIKVTPRGKITNKKKKTEAKISSLHVRWKMPQKKLVLLHHEKSLVFFPKGLGFFSEGLRFFPEGLRLFPEGLRL
jgi:hypothetical protein